MNTLTEVARLYNNKVEHRTIVVSNPRKYNRWMVDALPGEFLPGTEIKIARDILFLSGMSIQAGDEGMILESKFSEGDTDVYLKDDPTQRKGTVQLKNKDTDIVTVKYENGEIKSETSNNWKTDNLTIFLEKNKTYFQGSLKDVVLSAEDLVVDLYSPHTRELREDVKLSDITLKPRTPHNLQIRRGLVRRSSRTVSEIIENSFKYFEWSPAILLSIATNNTRSSWMSYRELSTHVTSVASHFPEPDSFVIISGKTTIPHYITYLAALLHGNVLVPVPANMPTDHVKQVITETSPSLVIADSDILKKWSSEGIELNCRIANLDNRSNSKKHPWDGDEVYVDNECVGYEDTESVNDWFCSTSIPDSFSELPEEFSDDPFGELSVAGLKTFPIYVSPVFAHTETDLLEDEVNSILVRLSSVCRNRTTGFIQFLLEGLLHEEEIVATLCENEQLILQGDTVLWKGIRENGVWFGEIIFNKDSSNEKRINCELRKYSNLDIMLLEPGSNTLTESTNTNISKQKQYYPKAGAALEMKNNSDEAESQLDCPFCKNKMQPRKSGKLTPIICMDCTKYVGFKSTQSLGCIRCNITRCERCVSDLTSTEIDWLKSSQDKPAMILYTSGSTGVPKGAIVPWKSLAMELVEGLSKSNLDRVVLLTGSLAVSSVTSKIIGCLSEGGRIAIDDEQDLLLLAEHVGPTGLSVVPQIANSMYKAYHNTLRNESDVESVRKRYSKSLGSRIRVINCGGAKPNPKVMDWLRSVFRQCVITENYATTEVGAISFCDGQGTDRRTAIKENVKIKLVDWMHYKSTDTPYPRGEICVKTPFMATGYLNRPDLTKDSFDEEGYFHTGDIGILDISSNRNRFITVIDRKKSFCKLANGEWITPENSESVICRNKHITQSFVFGTSDDPAIVSVVVLASHATEIPPEKIKEEIITLCKSSEALRTCEVPSAIHLLQPNERFTIDNGMLTISGKICRPKLRAKYSDILKHLRAEGRDSFEKICDNTVSVCVGLLETIISNSTSNDHEHHWSEVLNSQLSSIQCVQVCISVRLQLHVDIPPTYLVSKLSLMEIKKLISEKTTSSLVTKSQIESDVASIYDTYLSNSVIGNSIRSASNGLILVTGASGFLGVSITQRAIHKYGSDRVVVLIRPESVSKFKERFRRRNNQNDSIPKIICCDLSNDSLSISEDQLSYLKQNVSIIIHSAACVNHLTSYETLKNMNVKALARLLSIFPSSKFIHISTVSAEPVDLKSGYSASKYAAERLIMTLKDREVSIVRPGLIGPDLITGESNMNDRVIRYIHGCLVTGFYVDPEHSVIHLAEVGYCADCIIDVADGLSVDKKIITIKSSRLSVKFLFECINVSLSSSGRHQLSCLSNLNTWSQLIDDLPLSNPMYPLKSSYESGFSSVPDHPADVLSLSPPLYDQKAIGSIVESLYFNSGILSDSELLMKTLSGLSESME